VVQGLALLLVSFPVQVAAVRPVSAQTLLWLGVAVWVVGFLVEAVGDAQLAAYRRDPSRGPVLDRGLWAWTRHPNYFGDACVWWGVWLAAGAASGWLPGLLTVAAPLAMSYYLVFVTGARPLEAHLMERPAYRAYAGRTSMFLPRRPRP
jgi:steroid 5-alpha reductase family enzyme